MLSNQEIKILKKFIKNEIKIYPNKSSQYFYPFVKAGIPNALKKITGDNIDMGYQIYALMKGVEENFIYLKFPIKEELALDRILEIYEEFGSTEFKHEYIDGHLIICLGVDPEMKEAFLKGNYSKMYSREFIQATLNLDKIQEEYEEDAIVLESGGKEYKRARRNRFRKRHTRCILMKDIGYEKLLKNYYNVDNLGDELDSPPDLKKETI